MLAEPAPSARSMLSSLMASTRAAGPLTVSHMVAACMVARASVAAAPNRMSERADIERTSIMNRPDQA